MAKSFVPPTYKPLDPDIQRKINAGTSERLARMRVIIDRLPMRLPAPNSMAEKINFSDIPEKLDPSEFDGMSGVNPLNMPTQFPFSLLSAAAERAMDVYMNRYNR